jgi:hypothetical protein
VWRRETIARGDAAGSLGMMSLVLGCSRDAFQALPNKELPSEGAKSRVASR